ncbi:autotransporter beta-domain protein [Rhodobiaceae bacterium]|nr:autotransporter beta-domain protein [Rhodobiaceae bacterium]
METLSGVVVLLVLLRGSIDMSQSFQSGFSSVRSALFALLLLLVTASIPAVAAPGDPSAAVLVAGALPGETTQQVCLQNGFIQVTFFNAGGAAISNIESSTPCTPGGSGGGGNSGNGGNNAAAPLDSQQATGQVDSVVQTSVPGGVSGDLFKTLFYPGFREVRKTTHVQLQDALYENRARRVAATRERRAQVVILLESAKNTIGDLSGESRKTFLEEAYRLMEELDAINEFVYGDIDEDDLRETQDALAEQRRDVLTFSLDEQSDASDENTGTPADTLSRAELLPSMQTRRTELTDLLESTATELMQARGDSRKTTLDEALRLHDEIEAIDSFERGEISETELQAIQEKIDTQRRNAVLKLQKEVEELLEQQERNQSFQSPSPATNQNDIPSYFVAAAPLFNELHARFDLAAERRAVVAENGLAARPDGILGDERFNFWLGGDLTLHRDRRSTIGQEGESLSVDGGASYLISDDLNLGAALRYAHTDTEGQSGETIADTYTVSAFAQQQIFDKAVLEAVIAYSLVDLDLTFKNTGAIISSGTADATSLAGQVRVSQHFELERGWWLAPNLGASIVTTDRDSFTTTDGTVVGATRSTQVALVGGPTVGTSWVVKGAGFNYTDVSVAPSFGLSGNYNLGRFDRVIDANNNVFESDRFGLAASAGLGVGFAGGTTLSFNTNYAGIGADQRNITFGLRINMPLN